MTERQGTLTELVLVEDNPGDVRLICLALAEADLHPSIQVARDAHRGLELMKRLVFPPALILLDLNLPLITGDVFLRDLRAGGPWRDVPVVVLTSVSRDRDCERCFIWGASAFKVKPNTFDGYLAFAANLRPYLAR
jgi:CheY-like chemotaxis protein